MNLDDESAEVRRLADASMQGADAVSQVLEPYRDKLRRIVRFRLDRRIQQRVDPSDVIQDAFIEAIERLPEYIANPEVPLFVWLRFLAVQKMLQTQQRHLGVQARDPRREISLQKNVGSPTSVAIVSQLIGRDDTPTRAAVKAELRHQLEKSLDELDELDREVLALRHLEQLSNMEVARILKLTEKAASKRYRRALERLKKILES